MQVQEGTASFTTDVMKKKSVIITLLFLSLTLPMRAANSFTPGVKWSDTSGSTINAHGGCVVYANGYYWWFGEDRSSSTCNGVSCYRSTNLYQWQRVGLAVTPTGTATDDCRDIAKGRTMERPKVVYNTSTGKWVMWFHWENGSNYSEAKVAVLQSDKVEGPYTLCGVFRPNNHDSRDQTIFADSDGRAYHFCATDMNTNFNIALLSDDYLTPTSTEEKVLLGIRYEAPAIFRVGETYYGLFSGCTGWDPNRGRYAYTTDIMGNWVYGRDFVDSNGSYGVNFCVDSGKETTYKSQSAYVFQVNGRDKCFIYMGDRWNSSNVGSSLYVWLPLSMRSGYPTVRWYDSWSMDVFDEMYRHKRAAEIVEGNEYMLLEKKSNRFLSRPKNSFTIEDDNDSTNLTFILTATDKPYTYKIMEKRTGKYLESLYGSLRLNAGSDTPGQQWLFVLQEDGYYRIQNSNDGECISLSGGSPYAGTSIFLNQPDETIPQSFALYFDSKSHSDYKEADIFSRAYRTANLALMQEQASYVTTVQQQFSRALPTLGRIDAEGHLTLLSTVTVSAQLTLCDLTGRIVAKQKIELGTGETSLSLKAMTGAGNYILSILTPSGNLVKKIFLR